MKANLAVWPISFKVADNDLSALQAGIEKSREVITEFLLNAGFAQEQISYFAPRITDAYANQYSANTRSEFRYIAQSTVTTRSEKVALVKKSMEQAGALVGKGSVLEEGSWQNPTEYFYTKLNEIKLQMIEEATKNARLAAEQFAKDSGSKVGKIRNASQGYFSIEDRDRNSPDVKKIRVVTTVEYFLAD